MTSAPSLPPGPQPVPKQRRYVALLFADLCDSTAMSRELEAEEVADTLARYRDVCRAVVERHQGVIARLQGDGVLAVFGYPRPAEDAMRRALESAEDLRAAVPGIPSPWARPLQVHSGVHAGLVLIQEGDIERGRPRQRPLRLRACARGARAPCRRAAGDAAAAGAGAIDAAVPGARAARAGPLRRP
jgi:class 3 adenylate cyclase